MLNKHDILSNECDCLVEQPFQPSLRKHTYVYVCFVDATKGPILEGANNGNKINSFRRLGKPIQASLHPITSSPIAFSMRNELRQ